MTTRFGVFQDTHLLASFDAESAGDVSLTHTARKSLESRYGPLRARTMPFTSIAPIAGGEVPLPPSLITQ